MHKYEEVGPEKAIELLAKGKSVYIVIEARAGGFLAEVEDDPQPKYNWARETDEQEEEEEEQKPVQASQEKKSRSAFDWTDPEEEKPKEEPEKKTTGRKSGIDTGKIKALYNAGWKLKDIAEEIPCAQETARRTLIQSGLWKGKNNG